MGHQNLNALGMLSIENDITTNQSFNHITDKFRNRKRKSFCEHLNQI